MKNFLNSLLSRKFLLAVAALATFVANKQYTDALGVVAAYLGANTAQSYLDK